MFARARPKLAAYTHLLQFGDATADTLIPETRVTYDGPLVVGEDLMQFDIGNDVTVSQFQPEPDPA